MTLQVGYAQAVITPSLERPVYLAGFGRNRRARSVHDDLYARALALTLGHTELVLVALDLIGLGRQHCLAIERRVRSALQNTSLMIACTHTHHGPDTIGLWGSDEATSGVDPAYMAMLLDAVERVALDALSAVTSATVRTESVNVAGVAKNARNPAIVDDELSCIQFLNAEDDGPLATWLIFPCHPEVLWDGNPHITADYVHAMRRTVEARTRAPCLVMVGALGGMMTPDMPSHTFDDAEQMGETLGTAALATLNGVEGVVCDRLTYRRREFAVPMENPLFLAAVQADLLPDLMTENGMVRTEASLLQLGNAWFAGVPGELLPKLGLLYKSMMADHGATLAAVIGLANDELGYILPAEDFVAPTDWHDPGDSYEESMSMSIEAGPRLTEALRTLIDTR